MLIFTLGLLLKIAMTASIVVAASLVVERSGPFIGSLIASLPTAGGAAMIILAFQHDPSFIADSAIGSMVSGAIVAVFALAYAALAQRQSLAVSLGGAFLVWFAAAALSRLVDWSAAGAIVLTAIVFPLTIVAGRRFRSEGVRQKVKLTVADLAWRAGVVTLCVISLPRRAIRSAPTGRACSRSSRSPWPRSSSSCIRASAARRRRASPRTCRRR